MPCLFIRAALKNFLEMLSLNLTPEIDEVTAQRISLEP